MPSRKTVLLSALAIVIITLLTGTSLAAIILATTSNAQTTTTTTTAPRTCNNQPSYCDRSYSDLTQIGAHDSPFVGPLPQHNQNLPVTSQLDFGIRFLQAQTHENPIDSSIIQLCHTSCFLENAGTLEFFLEAIRDWLGGHPNDVVSLLLTNQDSFPVSKFDETFEAAGIREYAFVPASSPGKLPMDEWPTFGELIDAGTRLVVFLG
jgi:hypothetical protein